MANSKPSEDIELMDLDDEEERDRDEVKMYLKKYTKLFRFLFSKYANTGYANKNLDYFD
jgi:hypothetical protein